jgi:hypothetical protein
MKRHLWLFFLVVLLVACDTPSVNPPPCEGADCPQPCEGVEAANLEFRPVSMKNNFTARGEFNNCYTAREKVNGTFSFQLSNDALDVTQAVLRFDMVNKNGTSVLRDNPIIDTGSFKLTPDLTEPRTFFSKQAMLDGISVQGSFTFAANAPENDYRVVVSVVPTSGDKVPGDNVAPIVSFNYFFRIDR